MIKAHRLAGGIFGALILFASVAEAVTLPSARDYYPEGFQDHAAGAALKESLRSILDDFHVSEPGKRDRIADACPFDLKPSQDCFKRQTLSYEEARRYLFGDERFHLSVTPAGRYFIREVYCRQEHSNPGSHEGGIGPGLIPDANDVNTEHTWPQSKFHFSPKGFMKTDLHHLFPTNSKANSIRGNHPFGEVEEGGKLPPHLDCDASRVGKLRSGPDMKGVERGGVYFEPPDEHKGNAARAMFYFAVRYNMTIDKIQEKFLRSWHELDPVDDAEQVRNDAIYSLQQLRNPFIDHPELVRQIEDF